MSVRLQQFGAIARLSALEAMRQPICLLLASSSVLFIALLPMLVTHTLGESGKLIRDSALAVQFTLGLAFAAYAASMVMVEEIRRGTASSILSKPVGRGTFLLAKGAGVYGIMLAYCLMTGLATMISSRAAATAFQVDWWATLPLLIGVLLAYGIGAAVNYFTNRVFSSNGFILLLIGVIIAFLFSGFVDTHGDLQRFGTHYDFRIIPATCLIAMGILLLQGIAIALSTRLEAVPTLMICTVLFFLGLASDYLIGRHADASMIADLLYRLLPNWQHFWLADALTGDGVIPWTYVGHTGIYTIGWLAGLLMLTIATFRNMEIR